MPSVLSRARSSGSDPYFTDITESVPTSTNVTISWSVSPGAQGQIEYGTTASYGQVSTLETNYLSYHSQALQTLTPDTLYYYRIKAITASGVIGYSDQGTFTTDAAGSLLFPTTQSQPLKGPMPATWTVPASVGASVTITDYGENVRITRISDVTTYLMTYPVLQSWNADDSYLAIIASNAGGWRLYDGAHPHAFVRTFAFSPGVNNAIWSGVDPDHMWGLYQGANWIRRYVVSTNTDSLIRTFSNYTIVYAGDSSTMGDNGYIFLKGKRVTTDAWWIICYDTVNDVIVSEVAYPHPIDGSNYEPKNVHTSRSGTYGIVTYGAGHGYTATYYAMYQVDATCATVRNLFGTGSSDAVPHMSPGTVTANNQDCIVYFPGYMRNLVTNETTDLFPYATNKNDLNVQHINTGTPGWGTFSQGQNNGRTPSSVWGFDHIYMVRLDGSGQVRPWGYARGVVNEPYYSATDQDVYASASRGGNKMAFKSRNLINTSNSTRDGHLYVAERIT